MVDEVNESCVNRRVPAAQLGHAYSKAEADRVETEARRWAEHELQTRDSDSREREDVKLELVRGVNFSGSGAKQGDSFAHWAVQVGDTFYYHLRFHANTSRQPSDSSHPVVFVRDLVENLRGVEHETEMGETRLSSEQIVAAGRYLVAKFPRYAAFWNCHHFARVFVGLVAGAQDDAELFAHLAVPGSLFCVPDVLSSPLLSITVGTTEEQAARHQHPATTTTAMTGAAAADPELDEVLRWLQTEPREQKQERQRASVSRSVQCLFM